MATADLHIDKKYRTAARSPAARFLGQLFGYAGLILSLAFWLALAVPWLRGYLPQEAYGWLREIVAAALCSLVAAGAGSKLWRVGLPISVATFFFVLYVMGS